MLFSYLFLPVLFLASGVASGQAPIAKDLRDLTASDEAVLLSYLRQNAKTPDVYVIERFRNHDLVILGEMHEIRENLEFIAGLIPQLYHKAGVRCLATEFLRYRNTARANQIVTASEYQEDAVIDLHRDHGWPWGFKEYMDLFKAVWALNRSLPPGAEKFRILGLDIPVLAYELWVETDPNRKKEIQSLLDNRDRFMAEKLLGEGLVKGGGKVLLHTGFGHSYTHKRVPPPNAQMRPLGGYLHDRLGDRVFQICLHHRQVGSGRPQAGGPVLPFFLESLFEKNGNQPIGFDVAGSPFADLTNRDSPAFDPVARGTFAELTRGYIFLKPLAKLTKITWVDGYINQEQFERFRYIAQRRGWVKADECKTPAELDWALKRLFQPTSVPLPKPAKVDSSVFDAYAGVYEVEGRLVKVAKEQDRLWVDISGEGKFELFPESETVYFWTGSPEKRIVFGKNESGKVDRLIVRRSGGSEITARRTSP